MSNKNKNKNTVASGRHTAPKLAGFACCTQTRPNPIFRAELIVSNNQNYIIL